MIRSNGRPPVVLAGKVVNVYALAQTTGMDQGYLSRILSRKRRPRIDYAMRIAQALDMGLEDFLVAIDERVMRKAS